MNLGNRPPLLQWRRLPRSPPPRFRRRSLQPETLGLRHALAPRRAAFANADALKAQIAEDGRPGTGHFVTQFVNDRQRI